MVCAFIYCASIFIIAFSLSSIKHTIYYRISNYQWNQICSYYMQRTPYKSTSPILACTIKKSYINQYVWNHTV